MTAEDQANPIDANPIDTGPNALSFDPIPDGVIQRQQRITFAAQNFCI